MRTLPFAQLHLARGARDELDAEILLEGAERSAGDGDQEAESGGGRGDAAAALDRPEHAEPCNEVHGAEASPDARRYELRLVRGRARPRTTTTTT